MDEPESLRNIAVAMLSVLSIAGIIGNALVLFVFTRQKQKLSSTIFILTLAATDFATSFLTMPFTIAMEILNYNVKHDAICKLYHVLTTTTIPFSASVMVAIAVDRYLCIVHPFKHAMTIKRAKITVTVLAVFSVFLGLPLSLSYGVYSREDLAPILDALNNGSNSHEQESYFPSEANGTKMNNTTTVSGNDMKFIFYTGICHKNLLMFGEDFFNIYQKIYSAYFANCAVIVIILYTIIYRSVFIRRRKRLHLTDSCCGFLGPIQIPNCENNEHEQTELTMLNGSAKDKSPSSACSGKRLRDEALKTDRKDVDQKNGDTETKIELKELCTNTADRENHTRPNGISRAKLEKLRMANTKTALCLSIVAATYILAFLPAWLMALKIVEMNVVVFFMYFIYNVANPIIYAFLNQSFRNHLQSLLKCK
ncbi:5-hydroxytryptamine receptor 1A-alpha-like [Dreissena polymorpha]|nr:5-hydroxytryptamine receptor 1A-alpha-like [Dreissena polymorpha]